MEFTPDEINKHSGHRVSLKMTKISDTESLCETKGCDHEADALYNIRCIAQSESDHLTEVVNYDALLCHACIQYHRHIFNVVCEKQGN